MHHAQLTDYVRRTIGEYFSALGPEFAHAPEETILIRQGYYCGRRFVVNDWQAVWFIEERQIKFYDDLGRTVKTVAVETDNLKPSFAA